MSLSAFWEVMYNREQLGYHNSPAQWVLFSLRCQLWSAPLTPRQLYPVSCKACYVLFFPICLQYSPFILEKSDSALKIQLRSHLLQEVGPDCLCIEYLFSDVQSLHLSSCLCPTRL